VKDQTSSFAAYMVGFLVVMAVLVFAAVVIGVPQQYVAIGVAVLLLGFVAVVVQRSRARSRRLLQQRR
jgi:Flp pilus assembly protein TadB